MILQTLLPHWQFVVVAVGVRKMDKFHFNTDSMHSDTVPAILPPIPAVR
jgi:hypothetical protein